MPDPSPRTPAKPGDYPTQITISTGFAERVGPEGIRRWAQVIQDVADQAHGQNTREVGALLQDRLDAEGLAGPPVEVKRIGEAIAGHPGNSIAFVDDAGHLVAGPPPVPGDVAHQETEDDDRPLYS